MSKEVSDDDLEKRMRSALNINNWKGDRRFSDQEFRSAEALDGRRMANALNRTTTSRPVRYRPPVRVAEYYEVPANELGFGGGWTIVLVEAGYRRDHMSGGLLLRYEAGCDENPLDFASMALEFATQEADAKAPSRRVAA